MNPSNQNFDKALSGDYKLSIKSVFERANTLSKKSFASMIQALAILFLIMFVVSMLFIQAYDIQTVEDFNNLGQGQSSMINIVLTLVLAPLITGILMMGVSNARSEKTNAVSVFNFLSLSILLCLASLITSILITIGFALLIAPGLYLYLTTKFTLPLIADKRLSPINAIIMSVKILHRYAFHLLLIMLIFAVLMVVVFFTLGLAFIWVGPLYFNVFGVLYQDIVGDDTEKPLEQDVENEIGGEKNIARSNGETHFDA